MDMVIFGRLIGLWFICILYKVSAQYWDEDGGEKPFTDQKCPGPERGSSIVADGTAITYYTKCYKTRKEESLCFMRSNEDCFSVLRANLARAVRNKDSIVCCPGPCGWIYEHAWVSGQKSRPSGSASAPNIFVSDYEAIYQTGRELTETAGAVPAVSIRNSTAIYPALRAGCILPAPSANPVRVQTGTSSPPYVYPRTCPTLAWVSPQDSLSAPVCVQRRRSKLATSLDDMLYPETSCTIHCCQGDFCNGVPGAFQNESSLLLIMGVVAVFLCVFLWG